MMVVVEFLLMFLRDVQGGIMELFRWMLMGLWVDHLVPLYEREGDGVFPPDTQEDLKIMQRHMEERGREMSGQDQNPRHEGIKGRVEYPLRKKKRIIGRLILGRRLFGKEELHYRR